MSYPKPGLRRLGRVFENHFAGFGRIDGFIIFEQSKISIDEACDRLTIAIGHLEGCGDRTRHRCGPTIVCRVDSRISSDRTSRVESSRTPVDLGGGRRCLGSARVSDSWGCHHATGRHFYRGVPIIRRGGTSTMIVGRHPTTRDKRGLARRLFAGSGCLLTS